MALRQSQGYDPGSRFLEAGRYRSNPVPRFNDAGADLVEGICPRTNEVNAELSEGVGSWSESVRLEGAMPEEEEERCWVCGMGEEEEGEGESDGGEEGETVKVEEQRGEEVQRFRAVRDERCVKDLVART